MKKLYVYEQALMWHRSYIIWKQKNEDINPTEYEKAYLFYSICILLYSIAVFDLKWLFLFIYTSGVESISTSRCVRNLDLIRDEFISIRDKYIKDENFYYKFKYKFLIYYFIEKYIFSQDIEKIDLEKYQQYYDLFINCMNKCIDEAKKKELEQMGISECTLSKIMAENLYSNMKKYGLIDETTMKEIISEIKERGTKNDN